MSSHQYLLVSLPTFTIYPPFIIFHNSLQTSSRADCCWTRMAHLFAERRGGGLFCVRSMRIPSTSSSEIGFDTDHRESNSGSTKSADPDSLRRRTGIRFAADADVEDHSTSILHPVQQVILACIPSHLTLVHSLSRSSTVYSISDDHSPVLVSIP